MEPPAVKKVGVQHLVYAAGVGVVGTGVGSWESKLAVEAHMKALGLPWTVLRPMAFMELMTDKTFYPAVSTWHLMPKLMGADRPVPWLCLDDFGAIAARAFAERSLSRCRPNALRRCLGQVPRRYRSCRR